MGNWSGNLNLLNAEGQIWGGKEDVEMGKMEKGNGKLGNFFGQGCVRTLLIDKEHECPQILKLMMRETWLGIREALAMHPRILKGHTGSTWVKRCWKKKLKI